MENKEAESDRPLPTPDRRWRGRTMEDREPEFREELERLINAHSMESGSNTPDFILAEFLLSCLRAFDQATVTRTNWYAPEDERAQGQREE